MEVLRAAVGQVREDYAFSEAAGVSADDDGGYRVIVIELGVAMKGCAYAWWSWLSKVVVSFRERKNGAGHEHRAVGIERRGIRPK